MKKMGILAPAAPASSASKRAYDAVFARNLSPSHITALDELFPAARRRDDRASDLTPVAA